ncbi:MAG: hypothetical protein ACR2I0_09475, partial [Rhodoferax sp.]
MAIHISKRLFKWPGALAAALWLSVAMGQTAQDQSDPMADARIVGEARCADCHDSEKTLFGHTQHAKAFRENPRNDTEKAVCEACHG